MTETLTHWYSSESTQREVCNEYQHDRVSIVIKDLGILVLWTKVALKHWESLAFHAYNSFMGQICRPFPHRIKRFALIESVRYLVEHIDEFCIRVHCARRSPHSDYLHMYETTGAVLNGNWLTAI